MSNETAFQSLLTQLSVYISNEFADGDGSIGSEDDLLASGRIDSMGIMRLVAFLESEFDISVPPEDLTIENFETASTIARYVEASKSNRQQA